MAADGDFYVAVDNGRPLSPGIRRNSPSLVPLPTSCAGSEAGTQQGSGVVQAKGIIAAWSNLTWASR